MKCIFCGEEITRPKAKKYCSKTCWERHTSRIKYYKNIDKQREKSLDYNTKRKATGYYTKYNETIDKLAEELGLTKSQLREYGKTFLLENPEVIEVLRLINSNKDVVKTIQKEETRERERVYKKEYYIKNAELLKQRAKDYREKKKGPKEPVKRTSIIDWNDKEQVKQYKRDLYLKKKQNKFGL